MLENIFLFQVVKNPKATLLKKLSSVVNEREEDVEKVKKNYYDRLNRIGLQGLKERKVDRFPTPRMP